MRSAHALVLGILLALAAPGLRGQANPATQSGQKPAVAPAAKSGAKPVAAPTKPDSKAPQTGAKATSSSPKAAAQAPKQTAPTAKPTTKPAQNAPKAAAATKKPTAPAAKTATGAAKAAQAQTGTKPAAPAKKAAQAAPQPAKKPVATKPSQAATKKPGKGEKKAAGSAETEPKLVRRDPFESLVGRQKAMAEASKNLPPGKAGLQVSTLRLDGVVRAPNGMIAVVSNPQQRTYFLREGDQLYDGRVEKIMMDSVSFHEMGKDAFGKPVERQVNKRIYSSPGEQQ